MKTYQVTAIRRAHGWELHVLGEGVTQVRSLNHAVEQVRDFLGTLHDADFADAVVDVTPLRVRPAKNDPAPWPDLDNPSGRTPADVDAILDEMRGDH